MVDDAAIAQFNGIGGSDVTRDRCRAPQHQPTADPVVLSIQKADKVQLVSTPMF